ncbi:NaeI family type II restriction endonuclease [Actinomadura sp. DC4]|uniref:NaeI family type II restriction endonuclease n=1 Tax=Actinomadura sp. DC4 TaxID=3055069 RepID=UPI0025B1D84B|nr:NaeI family type II restriction endonuclease [Actinomadura sp. DC4]MDN3354623.1 NaeI family type II restriction endonuclease [Actinomadura sp. DC4]
MTNPLNQPKLFDECGASADDELSAVTRHLRVADPEGLRFARVIRETYDMLLDGQHTGRYRWDELYKTEKTHFGTLVEINLQREFRFADGATMDFAICGVDVDCKFSQKLAAWMIPPEAMTHLLLGLWANDDDGLWSAGLIRATEEVLSRSEGNRDRKRQLSKSGRSQVTWVFKDRPLPENALLRIPPETVKEIFGHTHGTKRVDALFRLAQGRRISRTVVATVARQDDYMKRVRGNGGSRSSLRPDGIVILGQYSSHVAIAKALHLPAPGLGEFVSVRLARRKAHHRDMPSVRLDGDDWVVAVPGLDDRIEQAPALPSTKRQEE